MSIVNTVAGMTPHTPITPLNDFAATAANHLASGDQAATAVNNDTAATGNDSGAQDSSVSSFEAILSNLLSMGSQDNIDEEHLFSALLEERLTTLKGDEAATAYHQYLESHIGEMTRSDGYIPVEDAARAALQDLVDEGLISTEEAEEIHAQAFQAAQFDENTGALYDSFGTTMAVTLVELAMQSSGEMMARFDSGELEAGRLSLDYIQSSSPAQFIGASSSGAAGFVGGDGFLFKPVSEGDGNLVVLLPPAMSGQVAGVSILDSNGQVLESGDGFGDFDDGRPIFRFDQPGSSYPDNIVVTVAMVDGSQQQYNIANPAQRYG